MRVFLIAWYSIFAFTALFFEPLYYYGCQWKTSCPIAESSDVFRVVKQIWSLYASWDPLFHDVPLWLQVLCNIEVIVFGPLYAVIVYGLLFDSQRKWLPYVALPFSGALIYSTIVYFAMEVLISEPNTNFSLVFLVNLPWTIIPIILVYYLFITSKTDRPLVKKD